MKNNVDMVIIKILLKICDLLSYKSKNVTTTDIFTIRKEIEKLEK